MKEGERMRRGLLVPVVLLVLSVLPLYAAAPPTVGLSISTLNNPFFVDLRDGAQVAAKRLNVNVVMLEGIAGTSAARDRGKGFRDGLKAYPGIKLVAVQTADFDRAKGLSVMENILQAQKKVDAVFAQNDEMALGAIQAIAAAKREKEMFVVGFDAIGDALAAIKGGRMAATIAQQPKVMGRLAVENAVKIIKKQRVQEFTPVPLELGKKQTKKPEPAISPR